MQALVFHGPGEKAWEEVPDAVVLGDTDAVVRVDATTICGTDLHILKGDVPAVTRGRILGHEGVGTITEVGSAVSQLAVGDNVIISCIKSCGRCSFCQQGNFAHCLGDEGASGIGWVFGHLIDGTQAEYVRVPYAETSVYKVPETVTNQQSTDFPGHWPGENHEWDLEYFKNVCATTKLTHILGFILIKDPELQR